MTNIKVSFIYVCNIARPILCYNLNVTLEIKYRNTAKICYVMKQQVRPKPRKRWFTTGTRTIQHRLAVLSARRTPGVRNVTRQRKEPETRSLIANSTADVRKFQNSVITMIETAMSIL